MSYTHSLIASRRRFDLCSHRILVHILGASSIKHKCLLSVATKDNHLMLIELKGRYREGLDEIRIRNFDVCPRFFWQWVAILLAWYLCFVELTNITTVKNAYHQKWWTLVLFRLLSWHNVNFLPIHDDCICIGDREWQGSDLEPMICLRIECLTEARLLIRHRDETT